MRKTICVFLAFGVTFGLWAAGCRENPRTDDLSERRAPGRPGRARRPAETAAGDGPVPALVDPEILAEPDQSNFARIRAVLDREAALAGQDGSETTGLFVIPRPNDFNLGDNASLVWSKPTPPLPAVPPGTSYAEDLVAMAPAGLPPPEPAAGLLPSDSPLLNPDSIPGLFFGPEEYLKSITPPSIAAASRPAEAPRPAAELDFPKLEPLPSPLALEAARATEEPPAAPPSPEREKPELPAETGGMELLPLLPVSGFGGEASDSVAEKGGDPASAAPAFPVPKAEAEMGKTVFHPAPLDGAAKAGVAPFRPAAAKRAARRDVYEYEPDVPPILDLRLP